MKTKGTFFLLILVMSTIYLVSCSSDEGLNSEGLSKSETSSNLNLPIFTTDDILFGSNPNNYIEGRIVKSQNHEAFFDSEFHEYVSSEISRIKAESGTVTTRVSSFNQGEYSYQGHLFKEPGTAVAINIPKISDEYPSTMPANGVYQTVKYPYCIEIITPHNVDFFIPNFSASNYQYGFPMGYNSSGKIGYDKLKVWDDGIDIYKLTTYIYEFTYTSGTRTRYYYYPVPNPGLIVFQYAWYKP